MKAETSLVTLKTPEQIATMRRAGVIVARILRLVSAAVRPGVSTAELDAIAAAELQRSRATSNFLHYGQPPFPAVICTSINEEVVHGIPSKKRILREGDLVGIDAGAIVDGWHADAAVTVPVGRVPAETARLIQVTEEALRRGVAQARPGKRLGDIGAAVQRYVEGEGFNVVRVYGGHGIGRQMHEDAPFVPNWGEPDRGLPIREGLTIAIEPMINVGTADTRVKNDGWTVVTADGSLSAHFEHTVAVTAAGPEVLTVEG
jgi:methionyl aminopeptidase